MDVATGLTEAAVRQSFAKSAFLGPRPTHDTRFSLPVHRVHPRVEDRCGPRPPMRADERPFPSLTPREYEVLDRVARGLRNDAIAARMGISTKTVQNTISAPAA